MGKRTLGGLMPRPIFLLGLIYAQIFAVMRAPAQEGSHHSVPAKDAYIMSFSAASRDDSGSVSKDSGPGPLRIKYSDGSEVVIPNERGRFARDDSNLTQENIDDVQLAADKQHIGWLADYMMCSQSYPCPMELVVYRLGEELRYFSAQYGVVWSWSFLNGGKQVAVRGGFPHGDEAGAEIVYDVETGREVKHASARQ
jgi:hypothetical protein